MFIPESESDNARYQRYVGHYAAAVAEALIADGLTVSIIGVQGTRTVWDDPKNEDEPDIEVLEDARATLFFGRKFHQRVAPGTNCHLYWDSTSGWYFFVDRMDIPYADNLAVARWLGAGLLPEPERVLQFASLLLLDAAAAGSSERPYYRAEHEDTQALIGRLDRYVPKTHYGSPVTAMGWERRHQENRNGIVSRQVVAAMTDHPDDPLKTIALRASEVEALRRLLELSEMSGAALAELAHGLSEDLQSRLTGRDTTQQRGLQEATRLKEHWEKYRK
jgi:hypothetical protein